jgi:thiamine pyrophosphate-dependent acetolactate synthase large subunit-like protein
LVAKTPDAEPIHPGRALLEIQKSLPEEVVWVRDGGAFNVWQMRHLRHNFGDVMSSSKMGMLGTGVPYGIGAQIAVGDGRRVCVITGDGSFGFYAMEIETAVRYKLPIVIIVGYDQGWALEVPYYTHCFGETYEVDHEFVRLDKMAETLGAHGEFCDSPEQVAPAITRAFASAKPALVQIMIDRHADAYDAPMMDWAMRWHSDKEAYV